MISYTASVAMRRWIKASTARGRFSLPITLRVVMGSGLLTLRSYTGSESSIAVLRWLASGIKRQHAPTK